MLATLSIAGIIVIQIYWVGRAFDLRENQFNRDVGTALRNVADRIFEINKTPSPANNPVDQLSTNYFVVKVNGSVDQQLLKFLLQTEFEKKNITNDFEYCIYDCVDKCIANGSNIAIQKTSSSKKLPDGYYFAVQFPQLKSNLISQMGIWGFSSVVLMVVILFFAYTLFVILKQRRLSEIQKDFINNMTHEFKTPLSTIAISSAVLKEPSIIQTPDRLLNYATIIENENLRLRQHVERVLQVASLDQKDIELKKELIDIHELVQAAVTNIAVALDEKRGSVTLRLLANPSRINVDILHIMNVLFNLLDNAIKYTEGSPQIIISTLNEGKFMRLDVQDNGCGILDTDLNKIFDRFYRVPTGNVHDIKGFGLGLHYVRTILGRHSGKIKVQSEPRKGSTFSLFIPVQ